MKPFTVLGKLYLILDASVSGGGYLMKFNPDNLGIAHPHLPSTPSWQAQNGIVSFRSEAETRAEMYNALGQKITSFGLSAANDFRFSSDKLEAGIYLISGNQNGRLFRLKILVK